MTTDAIEGLARAKTRRRSPAVRAAPWVLLTSLAGLGSLIFALPFIWMVSTSVKPRWEQMVLPPVWIPSTLTWANYLLPLTKSPILTWYQNTIILVVGTVIGHTLSSSLVAYGFARVSFPGRGLLFTVLLGTMMLPGQVTMIPVYYLFTKLHWIDTLRPLIVPSFFGSAFYIFLLRQFFMTIPTEMDDAAEIDGCNILDVYWRVMLPMCRPALGVVAIMQFSSAWNEFFGPLIYLNSPQRFTISLGLRTFQNQWMVQVGQVMAMTTLSLIPVLAVFYTSQRYFIQGIVITGVKG